MLDPSTQTNVRKGSGISTKTAFSTAHRLLFMPPCSMKAPRFPFVVAVIVAAGEFVQLRHCARRLNAAPRGDPGKNKKEMRR
jgi:hypothetical protein